jgi:hypothetical protein
MRGRIARFTAAFQALLLMATLVLPALAAATEISTDLWIYQYGDTVTVAGIEFGADEDVSVVTTDPYGGGVDSGVAHTDSTGGFTYQFVLLSDVSGIYDVVATGLTSGLTAATQFDPPTVVVTFPVGGATYSTATWNASSCAADGMCGTAVRNGGSSQLTSVDWTLQQGAGDYWDGDGFDSPIAVSFNSFSGPATTSTVNWAALFGGASFGADGQYTFSVTATQTSNGLTKTESRTFTIDNAGPVPSIAPIASQPDPTNSLPIEFDVTFDEAIKLDSQFTSSDISLTGSTANVGSAIVAITELSSPATANDEYRVSVSGVTGAGTVVVSVKDDAVTDALDNLSSPSSTASVTYDVLAPSAIVAAGPGQGDPTATLPIVFRVTFSEPIQGNLAVANLTFGGTADRTSATYNVSTISNGNSVNPTYDVSVNGLLSAGTITVSLVEGAKKDQAGNNSSASNTGSIQYLGADDTTPPVIAPHGDETVEATSASGAIVNYISPATSDDVDGAGVATCVPASGTQFTLGDTTVYCDASDAAGNDAVQTSFVVHVVDTTPPAVAVPADFDVEATGPGGAVVTFSSSALDIVDGAVATNCDFVSGTTLALDTPTLVTCSATDAHSNIGYGTFTVTVVDTTPPAVTVPANMTVEATSAAGAAATFSASAVDLVDGAVAATCVPASGSTFALDVYTWVTCSATDSHGNPGSSSFAVHVVDTTGPVIAPHADVTVYATSTLGAIVTYTSPTTSDLVDGGGVATCVPASGSQFTIGSTTVTCNATDAHGNAAAPSTFKVNVYYHLFGFYNPVDMGTVNTVKSGSTVPLKFEIFAGSTELTSLSYVQSFKTYEIACGAVAWLPTDEIEMTTSGNTSLRYDSTGGQFIQNWQTPKNKAGFCYAAVMTTTDGNSLSAFFKLK